MRLSRASIWAISAWIVLGPLLAFAEDAAAPTSFFVTSKGLNGGSGNLGGLRGADAHCQALAEKAGLAQQEWRAYLSTSPGAAHPGIDARDRIGSGPWYDAKGAMIAADVQELHSARNRIDRHTALTEKGDAIAGRAHDILTGSDSDGRLAYVYGEPATCSNWTSDNAGYVMMGHHDRFVDRGARFPRWSGSWVASHPSRGCDAERIKQTGSTGLFYCFSPGSSPTKPESRSEALPKSATFNRGLNIAHWLSHNYLPEAAYAAPWFDEDDVSWIAEQGFDHLRLRIGGDRLIDDKGDIDEDRIAPIDRALAWAKRNELGVVLTMHNLPGFRHGVIGEQAPTDTGSPFTDAETRYDAEYTWWQVARRYAKEGQYLRFELLHRPNAPDAASMRIFNETMLKAVRDSNPTRVVYLTSHRMDAETLSEVMDSDLISSDWNVALAFEFHDMDVFTAQFAKERPLVKFPGIVPDMRAVTAETDPVRREAGRELTVAEIEARFSKFAESFRGFAWGREIYLAEFCVYERADDQSAKTYIAAMRSAIERRGWSWAVYDYQSGCAVRGENGTGEPTRILRALDLKKKGQG